MIDLIEAVQCSMFNAGHFFLSQKEGQLEL